MHTPNEREAMTDLDRIEFAKGFLSVVKLKP